MMHCKRMRELRLRFRLTQKMLSAIMDVNESTYCNYEKGRRRIPVGLLLSLALLYNCSIDYLSGASMILTPYPRK